MTKYNEGRVYGKKVQVKWEPDSIPGPHGTLDGSDVSRRRGKHADV